MKHLRKYAAALMLCTLGTGALATDITANGAFLPGGPDGNGVIKIEMNGLALNGVASPMITRMWAGSTPLVPLENVGAGFQFASRSEGGNKYNPTLGGDCAGRAPTLGREYIQNFQPLPFVPAANGTLFGVQPLLYQGDQTSMSAADPGCTGPVVGQVAPAPYFFHFGAILGDGTKVPREAMLLAMAITKLSDTAPHLSKYLTEAPALFLTQDFAYAYTGIGKPDSLQFLPLTDTITGGNKVTAWRTGTNREVRSVNLIMQCNQPLSPAALCVALYSDFGVKAASGLRSGSAGQPDLVYLGLTGAPACNPVTDLTCNLVKDSTNWIVDTQTHTLSRIVAVGNPDTIRAAIHQTLQAVPITSSIRW